jgi:hypothetical protein
MRVGFGILLLFVSLGSAAALRADQITLKNGDRVTGTIVKKDGNSLTIASLHLGTVTMPWSEVDTITADVPAYIQIAGNSEPGTFNVSGGEITLISPSGASRTLNLADIEAIRSNAEQAEYERLQDPGLTELWAGLANLGFAGAAGNARTKAVTVAGTAARATRTDRTSVYFNAINASALVGGATTSTARAVRGGWAYQRDTWRRMFVNVFNDYEYDRFQSLDLRFVVGAGGGYHLIQGERTQLDVLTGLNYERARFSTPLTRSNAEFNWGNRFAHQLNSIITLTQSYRMFNSITDSPNFRANFDFGSVARVAGWLTWNVIISDRYLHNPVPGRLRNDVVYSTGLGVTFGRQ